MLSFTFLYMLVLSAMSTLDNTSILSRLESPALFISINANTSQESLVPDDLTLLLFISKSEMNSSTVWFGDFLQLSKSSHFSIMSLVASFSSSVSRKAKSFDRPLSDFRSSELMFSKACSFKALPNFD